MKDKERGETCHSCRYCALEGHSRELRCLKQENDRGDFKIIKETDKSCELWKSREIAVTHPFLQMLKASHKTGKLLPEDIFVEWMRVAEDPEITKFLTQQLESLDNPFSFIGAMLGKSNEDDTNKRSLMIAANIFALGYWTAGQKYRTPAHEVETLFKEMGLKSTDRDTKLKEKKPKKKKGETE